MAVALDAPLFVAGLLDRGPGLAQILGGVEPADPEEGFLQRPDEAFGAAVALGGAQDGREVLGSEKAGLARGTSRLMSSLP